MRTPVPCGVGLLADQDDQARFRGSGAEISKDLHGRRERQAPHHGKAMLAAQVHPPRATVREVDGAGSAGVVAAHGAGRGGMAWTRARVSRRADGAGAASRRAGSMPCRMSRAAGSMASPPFAHDL
ncbi:hypothetical protein ACIQ6R_36405 [Streptomyces sp. NPDC096048]|uniref:hypothetical protein n=1 Tax=Streptomyces sp. NPDC096048 TaxID=3366072 RepID=UPI00382233BC